MKIRLDYVTNSSSSSFVTFSIKNKKLVETLEKFNIDYFLMGSSSGDLTYHESWYEESTAPESPGNASIAEWLSDYMETDHIQYLIENSSKNPDLAGAISYLRNHANEIDACTDMAEFENGDVVTDSGGSSYTLEIHRNGKIQTSFLDETDWEYKKYGETLADALNGPKTKIKELAIKKNGLSELRERRKRFSNRKLSEDELYQHRIELLKDINEELDKKTVSVSSIFEGCNIARGDYWKVLPEHRNCPSGLTPQKAGIWRFNVLQSYIFDRISVHLTQRTSKKTNFIIFDNEQAFQHHESNSMEDEDAFYLLVWNNLLEKCNKYPELRIIHLKEFVDYVESNEVPEIDFCDSDKKVKENGR